MPQDHQNERPKGEVQRETGQMLKGPKPLKLGKQQQQRMTRTEQQQGGEESGAGQNQQGDERTPDKPIGQVAYADRDPAKKSPGKALMGTLSEKCNQVIRRRASDRGRFEPSR